MKFLKSLTAFALTAALAAGATTAFAADTGTTQSTTEVRTTVDSTYILTIPANQAVTFGAPASALSGALTVTGNVANNKRVVVAVSSSGSFTSSEASTSIPFTVTRQGSAAAFSSADWSAAELCAATPKSIALAVNVSQAAWQAAQAGSYTASITFTADIKDVT